MFISLICQVLFLFWVLVTLKYFFYYLRYKKKEKKNSSKFLCYDCQCSHQNGTIPKIIMQYQGHFTLKSLQEAKVDWFWWKYFTYRRIVTNLRLILSRKLWNFCYDTLCNEYHFSTIISIPATHWSMNQTLNVFHGSSNSRIITFCFCSLYNKSYVEMIAKLQIYLSMFCW